MRFSLLDKTSKKVVNDWKFNGKNVKGMFYPYDIVVLIDSTFANSENVIDVTCTLRESEKITIKFDEKKIQAIKSNTQIKSGTTFYEHENIIIAFKDTVVPKDEIFCGWKLNGKVVEPVSYRSNIKYGICKNYADNNMSINYIIFKGSIHENEDTIQVNCK